MSELDGLEHMFGDSEPTPATPETVAQEIAPEAAPAEPEAAAPDQPRDESGRFAPKAQPAEAAPVPPSPEPAPTQQAPHQHDRSYVPITVVLDDREKRQAAEARAAKLEADMKALRQQYEQTQQPPLPNPIDDPEGYASQFQEQRARERIADRVNLCEMMVRQSGKYTPEEIDAAISWGTEKAADQYWKQRAIAQLNPVEWTIREYKRDQLLSQIGDKDPKEWARELLAAEQPPQVATPAPQTPTSPSQPAPPSPSLASARSAGGVQSIPLGGEAAFEAMFQK